MVNFDQIETTVDSIDLIDLISPEYMPKLKIVTISDDSISSPLLGKAVARYCPDQISIHIELYSRQPWNNLPNWLSLFVTRFKVDGRDLDPDHYAVIQSFTNLVELDLAKCTVNQSTGVDFSWLPSSTQNLSCPLIVLKRCENTQAQRTALQNVNFLKVDANEVSKDYQETVTLPFTNLHALHIVDDFLDSRQYGDQTLSRELITTNPSLVFLQLSTHRGDFIKFYLPYVKKLRYLSVAFLVTVLEDTVESESRQFLKLIFQEAPLLETLAISVKCFRVLSYPYMKEMAAKSPLQSVILDVPSMEGWTQEEVLENYWHDFHDDAYFSVRDFCTQVEDLRFIKKYRSFSHSKIGVRYIYVDMDLLRTLLNKFSIMPKLK